MDSTDEAIARAERIAWLNGIRQMADFLEQHPDVPLPSDHQPVYIWGTDAKRQLAAAALALGDAEKEADASFFSLVRRFGPIVYTVKACRENVCERVVVGTKTITTQVPPEGVEMLTVTSEEEIVEWRCPPSILAFGADDEAVAS